MTQRVKTCLTWAAALAVCAALIMIVIFNSLQAVCFDLARYEETYLEYNTAEGVIGMTHEELMRVTEEMLQYLLGEREALDMQAEIRGQMRPVFGEREVLHMVDVQALFLKGLTARKVAYGTLALGFFLLVLLGRERAIRTAAKSWFWVLGTLGSAIAVVAVCFAVDFEGSWIKFHHIFFTNDLWLLDPRTEVLMMMFSNDFFMNCVYAIAWRVLGSIALMSALCGFVLYAMRKGLLQSTPAADASAAAAPAEPEAEAGEASHD